MNRNNFLSLCAFIFTIIVTLIGGLWFFAAEFNSLAAEENQLQKTMIVVNSHILLLDKMAKPIPLNSQLILQIRSEVSDEESKIRQLNSQLLILEKSLESYVDKQYFYRDMGIIKNDFRTTNGKVYVNTREINYIRGKLHVDNIESE